ncbi:uncharacterized protein SOCEGT47_028780 [Sorangium cellulosum]|uniref:Uncharacterized protein n=1 Tax=Sorangium cellulosum TaxID=56 RepID=A0A4P2PZM1_SORCE|nr:uncharacterized protein SOCEGT47_028780 [Sorangium cellulosum]
MPTAKRGARRGAARRTGNPSTWAWRYCGRSGREANRHDAKGAKKSGK